jgi:hypothetical protein
VVQLLLQEVTAAQLQAPALSYCLNAAADHGHTRILQLLLQTLPAAKAQVSSYFLWQLLFL